MVMVDSGAFGCAGWSSPRATSAGSGVQGREEGHSALHCLIVYEHGKFSEVVTMNPMLFWF